MAAGFKIADGYIEVHSEVDHGEIEHDVRAGVASISHAARTVKLVTDIDLSELRSDIVAALHSIPQSLRTVQVAVDLDPSHIGSELLAALRSIPSHFRTIELHVDVDVIELGRKIAEAIRMVPASLRTITVNVDIDMGAALAQLLALRALLTSLGGFGGGLGDLGSGLGSLGGSFTSLANPVGLVVSLIVAMAAASLALIGTLTLLAPIVYAVAGALGAASTVMVGMVGVGATLALALRGVAGAIKSMVTEGKVSEDVLKTLSPAARSFVLALTPVKGLFEDIGRLLQERLFAGLAKELTNLIDRLGPLIPFLGLIADGINSVGVRLLRSFSDTRNVERIASIFDAMSRFLVRIGDVIPTVVGALVTIGEAAIPVVTMLGDGISKLAGRFAQWLEDVDKSGALQSFFVDAARSMRDLFHIGGLVLTILGQVIEILFPKSKETSSSIFSGVRDGLQSISDWLEKPENQARIRGFVDGVMLAFEWLQREGIPMLSRFIDKVDKEWIPTVAGWITTVDGWVHTVEGWGATLGGVIEEIENAPGRIGTAVASIPATLGGVFDGIEDQLGFSRIADAATNLPGQIMAGLAAIPGIVQSLLVGAFDSATYGVGFAAGTIVALVVGIPIGVYNGLIALPGIVAGIFTIVKDTVVPIVVNTVNTVVDFFANLPGRVANAVSNLAGAISGAFFSARDLATGQADATSNSVVDNLRSLPGRAAAALSGFAGSVAGALRGAVDSGYGIGEDIMRGVASGISAGIGWVVDVARRAAGNIVRGFKDALGVSSPSKVMAREVGRWIPAGIGAGVDAGMPALRSDLNSALAGLTLDISARPGSNPAWAAGTTSPAGVLTGPAVHQHTYHNSFVVDASDLKTQRQLDEFMRNLQRSARTMTAGV